MQVCFERTDALALTAGKVIAINLHQKQTLKRTGATVSSVTPYTAQKQCLTKQKGSK